jgi:hypothetical protein
MRFPSSTAKCGASKSRETAAGEKIPRELS